MGLRPFCKRVHENKANIKISLWITQLIMLKKLQGGEKTYSRSPCIILSSLNDWTYLEIKLLKVLLERIVPFQNLKYLMLLVCSDMYMMYLVVNLVNCKGERANHFLCP